HLNFSTQIPNADYHCIKGSSTPIQHILPNEYRKLATHLRRMSLIFTEQLSTSDGNTMLTLFNLTANWELTNLTDSIGQVNLVAVNERNAEQIGTDGLNKALGQPGNAIVKLRAVEGLWDENWRIAEGYFERSGIDFDECLLYTQIPPT
ncbi:14224_t:CDS:2, partial [Funneliformis geosporum]